MFGFDNDDDIGTKHFEQELQPWLDDQGINYTAMSFSPLGYIRLNEYVIKKSSVNKYGRGLLDMINEGKVPAKKMKSYLKLDADVIVIRMKISIQIINHI